MFGEEQDTGIGMGTGTGMWFESNPSCCNSVRQQITFRVFKVFKGKLMNSIFLMVNVFKAM